jgi:hypothetical protein
LRKLVFVGDEPVEQAFIYHYETDHQGHLCLGNGSDKYAAIFYYAMLV